MLIHAVTCSDVCGGTCADTYADICGDRYGDVYGDMYGDVYGDVYVDMHVDTYAHMCVGMCVDIWRSLVPLGSEASDDMPSINAHVEVLCGATSYVKQTCNRPLRGLFSFGTVSGYVLIPYFAFFICRLFWVPRLGFGISWLINFPVRNLCAYEGYKSSIFGC